MGGDSRPEAWEAAKKEVERAGYSAIEGTFPNFSLSDGHWSFSMTATNSSGEKTLPSVAVDQLESGFRAIITSEIN